MDSSEPGKKNGSVELSEYKVPYTSCKNQDLALLCWGHGLFEGLKEPRRRKPRSRFYPHTTTEGAKEGT